MTLNIAMVSFNIEGRGTYQRAYYLAKELAKLGHKITLLASSYSGDGIYEKTLGLVNIVTFPRLLKNYQFSGWGLYEMTRRLLWTMDKNFDIVHSFEMRPTCLYPSLSLMNKGSILISDWADWLGKGGSVEERPNFFFRTLLRPFETYYENNFRQRAQGITVICKTLYNKSLHLGIDPGRILYLPNGFENPHLSPLDIDVARSKLGLSSDVFIIGYIGSGFKRDMELMSASFAILRTMIPNLILLHIGRSNYFTIKSSDIIQTGTVSDAQLSTYLSACNIFWLPLRNTNANSGRLPLKLSDYLTIGRPIISSAVGDIPELINQSECGLITRDDPIEIAKKMFFIYNNPNIQKDMGQRALNLSKTYSESWAARASSLDEFYEKLLSK